MSYKAKDGKRFPTVTQGLKWDRSLAERGSDDVANAPGGTSWEHDLKTHGIARETRIIREGNGRHVLVAIHADGYRHQSVHPEAYRAHEIESRMLGIEAPPAIQTHARARSQPVGPKEEERIAKEDGRLTGVAKWSDFEDEETR